MNSRVRTAGLRALDTAAAARARFRAGDRETGERLDRLARRVEALERELEESRRLNRRIAELTDVVQELLLPIAQRDEDKIAETLQRYSAAL